MQTKKQLLAEWGIYCTYLSGAQRAWQKTREHQAVTAEWLRVSRPLLAHYPDLPTMVLIVRNTVPVLEADQLLIWYSNSDLLLRLGEREFTIKAKVDRVVVFTAEALELCRRKLIVPARQLCTCAVQVFFLE